jgi:protein gp37
VGDTKIEWTKKVWNPVTGCHWASPGCDNCYAHVMANRLMLMPDHPRAGHPFDEVMTHEERLNLPSAWKKPQRIFVTSMGDLFLNEIAWSYVDLVFDEMERNPRHDFQVLTKRPEPMKRYVNKRYPDPEHPCPAHIWLGTSIEDMDAAWRAKMLRETNATVRWISAEPLIGSLKGLDLTTIGWAVVGGESAWDGKRRDMKAAWSREMRDKCIAANVPFFFKQWGGRPNDKGGGDAARLDGQRWNFYPLVDPKEARRWRARLAQMNAGPNSAAA